MTKPFAARLKITAVFVLLLALVGCAGAPPSRHWDDRAGAAPVASRLSLDQAQDVTIYALSLVGTPYRYGGNTPQGGFDCSGLIGHVYKTRAAVVMPRTVSQLQDAGRPVSAEQLRSGDLVIFSPRKTATHAGIYVGAGRFVHAPSSGGEVRLDQLASKYWAAQAVEFRRP